MAFVITQPCIGTKDTACVEVCPVDCSHPVPIERPVRGVAQLYIDPDKCIDCGACEPECPVDAIFPEEDVPEEWASFIEKNADWYRLSAEEFEAKWNEPGRKELTDPPPTTHAVRARGLAGLRLGPRRAGPP